jgi:hypothetical protein
VLAWLNKHPSYWKAFVANGVLLIQSELPLATCSHVSTMKNPAELATHEIKLKDLVNNNLWRRGQGWLKLDSSRWPKAKPGVQALQVHTGKPEPELIKRFSLLMRMTRAMACC